MKIEELAIGAGKQGLGFQLLGFEYQLLGLCQKPLADLRRAGDGSCDVHANHRAVDLRPRMSVTWVENTKPSKGPQPIAAGQPAGPGKRMAGWSRVQCIMFLRDPHHGERVLETAEVDGHPSFVFAFAGVLDLADEGVQRGQHRLSATRKLLDVWSECQQ